MSLQKRHLLKLDSHNKWVWGKGQEEQVDGAGLFIYFPQEETETQPKLSDLSKVTGNKWWSHVPNEFSESKFSVPSCSIPNGSDGKVEDKQEGGVSGIERAW